MTHRGMCIISRIWKGVFMLLIATTSAQIEKPVPLTRENLNVTHGPVHIQPGNYSDLRKTTESYDSVLVTTLKDDGEGIKPPFYSSTTLSIATNILKPSSYDEKPNNQDSKAINLINTESGVQPPKKHLLEKLMEIAPSSTVLKTVKQIESEKLESKSMKILNATNSVLLEKGQSNVKIESQVPLELLENDNSTETDEKNNKKPSKATPKARTIIDWSESGTNEFSSSEEKVTSSLEPRKESLALKNNIEKHHSFLNNISKIHDSTDELVLENTIGRSQHTKLITTESSVIDNSIQSVKPIHYKRSGNISTDSNNSSWPSTSLIIDKDDLNSSTTIVNDIPENHPDWLVTTKPTDLIENSLTKAPETNTSPDGSNSTDTLVLNFSSTTPEADVTTVTQTLTTTLLPTVNSTSQTAVDSTSVKYEFIGFTDSTEVNLTNDSVNVVTDSSNNTFPTELTTNLSSITPNELTTESSTENFSATTSITAEDIDTTSTTDSISDDNWSELPPSTVTTTNTETTVFMEENTTDSGTTVVDNFTDDDFVIVSTPSTSSPTTLDATTVEISEQSTLTSDIINTSPSEIGVPETFSTDSIAATSFDEATTIISTIEIVTEITRIPIDDVTLLIKIVIEGSWSDICPNVPALKKSLADLLTVETEKIVLSNQIIFQKNSCTQRTSKNAVSAEMNMFTFYIYVVGQNRQFDSSMTKILPNLYHRSSIKSNLNIRSFQLVQDPDSGNTIAVIVVSCVAFICLILLTSLLFIMRKRQTRFNYGERCRPVSLDAYSLDSVPAYNSVRRKGAIRSSKRSYGNPAFEDSSATPSHPLNFSGLSAFCNEQNAISEEFTSIPQVSARIDELPPGAEVKNRYANVVPLPETRVPLNKINNDPLTEYINASYVRGPKNVTKYYIACQAPIESTVTDFWRMIWEQQSKVIIMLTDLIENGVEKCAEYIPPSEVTDCHRLYGDLQVTLKKRETKEKYAISTLHLKNLENNTYREVSHIWYLWPANGVQTDGAGLIAILLEARALQRGGSGPIVVHCSPGTGRTGTLIALDLGIRQYEITRTVDVPRVVYTIRRDRAGAVQTKEQYGFIYEALNLYAAKLAGGGLESA